MKFVGPLIVSLLIVGGLAGGLRSLFIARTATPVAVSTQAEQLPSEQTMPRFGSWFSGLSAFPSFPVFAYPGAYRLSAEGLEIGFPVPQTSEKLIAAAFLPHCTVRATTPIHSTRILGYGDFHVRVELTGTEETWQLTLVQGSPVVYLRSTQPLQFSCTDASAQTKIIFATRAEATDQYRIVLIPDEQQATAAQFAADLPWVEPTGTRATHEIDPGTKSIETTLTLTSKDAGMSLLTHWPHHGQEESGVGSYQTVIGPLRAVVTNTVTTRTQTPALPLTFTRVTSSQRAEEIISAIRTDSSRYLTEAPPGGVYFKGTWIGGLTSLIQLADLYGETALRDQLLTRLEAVLLPTLVDFHYDPEKFLWVANQPEFGNEKGNDHHFHYGYYIRAASILVHFRPTQRAIVEPAISEMIADVASVERSDRYARLRVFSPYESHSWASGDAAFADGNNQESSSEALNAWYAIKIWGEVTSQQPLSDLGTWLFSQELMGTQSYWFGIANPFPAGYNRALASLVWGGKREFATWFSADPMHAYGIQWLPITPASSYLRTAASASWFAELDRLGAVPATHEWGDLYTAVRSLTDPQAALELVPQIQTTKGMYLHSLLLQTVYANQEK